MGGTSSKSSQKKAPPAVNDVDMAILNLKAQRKKLADQQKLMDIRIVRHTEVAKALLAERQRDRALIVLKKKKLDEKQWAQLSQLQMNIESLISDVEMSKQQTQLFAVLKQGNDALKQLQQQVSVDDVRKLMDDTAEAKALQDEMALALSQSLSAVETDEVEGELAAMEEQALAAEAQALPSVPQTKVPHAVVKPAGTAITHTGTSALDEADGELAEEEHEHREPVMMAA